jgi:hypothetical protein
LTHVPHARAIFQLTDGVSAGRVKAHAGSSKN